MNELIKALSEKITSLTGLVCKYNTNIVEPNTPNFNLIYKGITPKRYNSKNETLTRGILKFDLVYQSQWNNDGDMVNYIDNELNLLKLFKYVMPHSSENKQHFDISDTTTYNSIKLYTHWNINEVETVTNPFTDNFLTAKKTYKIELEYQT